MTTTARPTVLVTGSAGYLGSAVVRDLARDHEVVGFDLSAPAGLPPHAGFIPCDLTDDGSVLDALAHLRREHGTALASCVHLAAHYDFSGAPSPLYRTLTIEGTQRLLHGLRDFELGQFLFASTHIVMKPAAEGDVIREHSPVEPAWAYPRSKLAAERLIAAEHGDVPAIILRLAGVYDEQTHVLPIAQQMRRIYEKQVESYLFPGDATHGQAFIHLADAVACVRKVVEQRRDFGGYDVFLVAEPEVVSYDELQEQIGELIHGRAWPTIRIPKSVAKFGAWVQGKLAGEQEDAFIKPWMIDLADDHYPIAIDHARRTLGWQARRRLRMTLPKMVGHLLSDPERWYEENGLEMPASLAAASGQETTRRRG